MFLNQQCLQNSHLHSVMSSLFTFQFSDASLSGGQAASSGGLSGGEVAGIVIGVLLLVGILAGAGFIYKTGRMRAITSSVNASRGVSPNQPKQFNNPIDYNNQNSAHVADTTAA